MPQDEDEGAPSNSGRVAAGADGAEPSGGQEGRKSADQIAAGGVGSKGKKAAKGEKGKAVSGSRSKADAGKGQGGVCGLSDPSDGVDYASHSCRCECVCARARACACVCLCNNTSVLFSSLTLSFPHRSAQAAAPISAPISQACISHLSSVHQACISQACINITHEQHARHDFCP